MYISLATTEAFSLIKLLQLCPLYPKLDFPLQHFLEFGDIFGFRQFYTTPITTIH